MLKIISRKKHIQIDTIEYLVRSLASKLARPLMKHKKALKVHQTNELLSANPRSLFGFISFGWWWSTTTILHMAIINTVKKRFVFILINLIIIITYLFSGKKLLAFSASLLANRVCIFKILTFYMFPF